LLSFGDSTLCHFCGAAVAFIHLLSTSRKTPTDRTD
jgi:hypothetical protein